MRNRPALFVMAVSCLLDGCAPKTHPLLVSAIQPNGPRDFIDLQLGWRLRVVTPVLKSGKYKVETKNAQSAMGTDGRLTVTATADKDFLGYERAYFSVAADRASRLRLAPVSATMIKDGTEAQEQRPIAPIPALPGYVRFVRLLYVTRVSRADHAMAVIASQQKDALELLTRQVSEEPNACKSSKRLYCSWIPDGISVVPERYALKGSAMDWIPAP